MQNQSSSLITFDTQLKTALFIITTTGLNKEIPLWLVMWGRDAGIKSGCSEQLFLAAIFFFASVRRTKQKRPFLYQSQGQLKLKLFLEENTVSLKSRSNSSIALQTFFLFQCINFRCSSRGHFQLIPKYSFFAIQIFT